jgi:3-oxoacyl-[acyl-carrier-protein] synthase-3
MDAYISAIDYYLPEQVLTNEQLAEQFPEWSVGKIAEKTGIYRRHISGPDECASDLAVQAAQRLFAAGGARPDEVDYVIFCTQSPDYALPTTACMMQHRLGIPRQAGALDMNLGCSGYIYGLGLAKGLLETGQARCVLLLTAETYSKFIRPEDKNVRTIFGDGAAATVLRVREVADQPSVGPFVYGTDGAGALNLVVEHGGARRPCGGAGADAPACLPRLFMNGPEIFTFTLRVVPSCIEELLKQAGLQSEAVDLFVFHQANQYMLDHLRAKCGVPQDRFYISLADSGNTVSATIPIALKRAEQEGKLKPGMRVMLVGFGVGYSWGGTLIRWQPGRVG